MSPRQRFFECLHRSPPALFEAALADPYAGTFDSMLLDDAITFHDVALVGTSAQNDASLALLHA